MGCCLDKYEDIDLDIDYKECYDIRQARYNHNYGFISDKYQQELYEISLVTGK
ncbi:MAG: hypothetical protein ACW98D_14065 [Promethearchaeota archaeon]|jgi:hypothetical protein